MLGMCSNECTLHSDLYLPPSFSFIILQVHAFALLPPLPMQLSWWTDYGQEWGTESATYFHRRGKNAKQTNHHASFLSHTPSQQPRSHSECQGTFAHSPPPPSLSQQASRRHSDYSLVLLLFNSAWAASHWQKGFGREATYPPNTATDEQQERDRYSSAFINWVEPTKANPIHRCNRQNWQYLKHCG